MRWALITLASLALAAPAPAADTTRTEAAGLRFAVPRAWRRVPTLVENRAAMYTLPAATGDAGDPVFVVSVPAQGQSVKAQDVLEGWYGRFVQSDGRPSAEAAEVTPRTVRDLRVTAVDLAGTYVGAGASSGAQAPGVSGYRLLGAVVEGHGHAWILHLFGPAATVAAGKADFETLLGSLESHR
jgi:hypothetical protein